MKTKNIAILTLAVLAVGFMGATAANAATQSQKQKGDANRPTLTDEQKAAMESQREEMQAERDAIQTAITDGDYDTWKELITERQAKQVNILDVISEDNFDKFAKMHQLMEDGDTEEARAIAEELGLNNVHGMGMGMGMRDHGMGHGRGIHSNSNTDTSTEE